MKLAIAAVILTGFAAGVSGQVPNQPRVYLDSASKGSNRNSDRDQSMEMSKDFLKGCPNVKITINQNAADYTVRLNHIEHGLLYRDNQTQVFDKNGDLLKNKEGGSIRKNVNQVCALINDDWATKTTSAASVVEPPAAAVATPAAVPAKTSTDTVPPPAPFVAPVATDGSSAESLGAAADRIRKHKACLKLAEDNPNVGITCN
jgi:hypothetical protein